MTIDLLAIVQWTCIMVILSANMLYCVSFTHTQRWQTKRKSTQERKSLMSVWKHERKCITQWSFIDHRSDLRSILGAAFGSNMQSSIRWNFFWTRALTARTSYDFRFFSAYFIEQKPVGHIYARNLLLKIVFEWKHLFDDGIDGMFCAIIYKRFAALKRKT